MANVDLEKGYMLDDRYDLPIRDQGDKNNCTSHAFAYMIEWHLSNHFEERAINDVNDLWEKQLKYGTATEEGDLSEGPFIIATNQGVKFRTDSGISGTVFLTGEKRGIGPPNAYVGWRIVID